MLIRLMTVAVLSLGTMACASANASPEAGWRLNPALCPDLREDRRDRADRVRRGAFLGTWRKHRQHGRGNLQSL
ncbi:MAG: hypothetical protein AAGA69_09710, partial [Pseudomonadota bacterium]